MTIHVFLVDDHALFREGLRSLLEAQPDIRVVGEAANGRDAVDRLGASAPDVVLLDVTMPEMNGFVTARRIVDDHPGVRVIALSMHSDPRFVRGMFDAGARGYLVKDAAFDEVAAAIRTVASGGSYVSGGAGGRPGSSAGPGERLTSREIEVLQLLAEGSSTKGIAYKLHRSVKTVESHRRNIIRKVGTDSVAELTKYALRQGLVSL
jgi:DNA-binding NarL/FixJ family response regulator